MTYYTVTGNPATLSRGSSSLIRAEFTLIQTAFGSVLTDVNLKANIASPAFTGTPTAPTASPGTSSTQIATTAFVAATAFSAVLPAQGGNNGKFLTTDGSTASWSANIGTLDGNNAWTGYQTFGKAVLEKKTAVSASDIDMQTGNYFSKTISGTTTFTVSNVPASGTVASFLLDLTNGGSATVNWWSGVKWVNATAPTLTTSGRDVLGFFTHDGGTTWTGLVLGKDVK